MYGAEKVKKNLQVVRQMNDFKGSVIVGLKTFPPFLNIDWGSRVGRTLKALSLLASKP